MTHDPSAITPVQPLNGIWFKREDLFRHDNGVNGAKLRACFHLAEEAKSYGARTIVSAASVRSPQSAMAATVARELDMQSVTIVGGTTAEKAVKHQAIELARRMGSTITAIPVGYNPALQAAGRSLVSLQDDWWQLPYGISTPADATLPDIRAFVEVGSPQVENLPQVDHLVLPLGSGNTAAGVLWGLASDPYRVGTIEAMVIGPSRWEWVVKRLHSLAGYQDGPSRADVDEVLSRVKLTHLHPTWAEYGDSMPETMDGIVFHPTYEGKIIRYLNFMQPSWWAARDLKTAFWIVGGPL